MFSEGINPTKAFKMVNPFSKLMGKMKGLTSKINGDINVYKKVIGEYQRGIRVGIVDTGAGIRLPGYSLPEKSLKDLLTEARKKAKSSAGGNKGSTEESLSGSSFIGEKGVEIPGSKTVGQKGKTERVDIENPSPGKGDGNMHYHEPNNTKWMYDFKTNKLVDRKGKEAPPKIQKVLDQSWVKKAIEKGKKYLGE